MGARTSGREAALQMLYAFDVQRERSAGRRGRPSVEQVALDYWEETPGEPEGREYAAELVRGAVVDLGEIDALIRAASRHWRVERMARVDRNVLRLGTYELRARPDVPRAVIIDEAVELAKRYGAEGSGVFVNGVLDRIAEDLGRRDEPATS
ncbi:MAG: transcription antitermination factor NusB [Deltaproteobacteria bacterium]|nr:transcription antitermination factor NusB [Deltaproteobacteria bacterium]